MTSIPSIAKIYSASRYINESPLITATRCDLSRKLSEKYEANIYLKREDMQLCRSFKIRGAVNSYMKLSKAHKNKGIVVASDGNFSTACAYVAQNLQVHTTIFVPKVIQQSKIDLIKEFGKEMITLIQEGDNFEDAWEKAQDFGKQKGLKVIHPYDNEDCIEGNGTISLELLKDVPGDLDFVFSSIGGGALAAGLSIVLQQLSPETKVIGIEPEGANSMQQSIAKGKVVEIQNHSRFCDGSAIKQVAKTTFNICKNNLQKVDVVSEGQIAQAILQLYDNGVIVEPAGALAVAGLELNKELIKGKNVVCIISGGNIDLSRLDKIREMALIHEGLKYFFLINFPLRQNILREFIQNCLQETDEISHIQFNKKTDRERAPALIAVEVKQQKDVKLIQDKMTKMGLDYQIVNENKELYDLLV